MLTLLINLDMAGSLYVANGVAANNVLVFANAGGLNGNIPPSATLQAFPIVEKHTILWCWMGERPADAAFRTAVARGDSIVLVKGPRQAGKTSLLARGLQSAREAGHQVVLTDLQKLDSEQLGAG